MLVGKKGCTQAVVTFECTEMWETEGRAIVLYSPFHAMGAHHELKWKLEETCKMIAT